MNEGEHVAHALNEQRSTVVPLKQEYTDVIDREYRHDVSGSGSSTDNLQPLLHVLSMSEYQQEETLLPESVSHEDIDTAEYETTRRTDRHTPTTSLSSLSSIEDPNAPNELDKLTSSAANTAQQPYTYGQLIGMSLLSAPDHRLTASQIHHWIAESFPSQYPLREKKWQSGISAVLTQRPEFVKQARGTDDLAPGRGGYWALQPGTEHKFPTGSPHTPIIENSTQATSALIDLCTSEGLSPANGPFSSAPKFFENTPNADRVSPDNQSTGKSKRANFNSPHQRVAIESPRKFEIDEEIDQSCLTTPTLVQHSAMKTSSIPCDVTPSTLLNGQRGVDTTDQPYAVSAKLSRDTANEPLQKHNRFVENGMPADGVETDHSRLKEANESANLQLDAGGSLQLSGSWFDRYMSENDGCYTVQDLFEDCPDFHPDNVLFDKEATMEEIKKRPSRKAPRKQRLAYARSQGKNPHQQVTRTLPCNNQPPRSKSASMGDNYGLAVNAVNGNVTMLDESMIMIKEYSSIEELLGLPEEREMILHEGELAFRAVTQVRGVTNDECKRINLMCAIRATVEYHVGMPFFQSASNGSCTVAARSL